MARHAPTQFAVLKAMLVLGAERLMARLWPFLTLFLACFALALSGWVPALTYAVHILVLIAVGFGLAALFVTGIRGFKAPSLADARRRVEDASGLAHRPLSALQDAIAAGGQDAASQTLWEAHQKRLAASVTDLRAGIPEPYLKRRDVFALRISAALLALIAVLSAGANWSDRLVAFFTPTQAGTSVVAVPLVIDAWVTPPVYTGAAPIFLSSATDLTATPAAQGDKVKSAEQAIPRFAVPDGSALVVQVTGAPDLLPRLTGAGLEISEETLGADGTRFASKLLVSEKALSSDALRDIRVETSEGLAAHWKVAVIPDKPPSAQLGERVLGETLRNSRELFYKAEDDYGLQRLEIVITLQNPPEGVLPSPIIIELPTALNAGGTLSEGSHFLNQIDHIWAGEPVIALLQAEDALGQVAQSEPVEMTLPSRDFVHPVALEIIKLRKDLALRGYPAVPFVAQEMRRLGLNGDAYAGDVTVFLGLTMTARALGYEGEKPEFREEVVDLLWELALRLEDGDLSIAERRLRQAERALMEALNNGASDDEIDRLMDELQEAMNDYLRAMAQNALEQMQSGDMEATPFDNDAQEMAQSDINDIMERIREMLNSGMRDAARRMLEQLQRMMENLQASAQQRPSLEGMEAMEMLEGLQELMQGQRELLDRSFQQSTPMQRQFGQRGQQRRGSEQGQQGQQGQQTPQMSADATLQEALRRQLGDIMQRFGEMMGDVPAPFGQADQEMRGSTDALRRGQPGEAVDSQGRALDQLQEAARAAQEAFMERFGNEMGQGPQGLGQTEELGGEDPFGRSPNDITPGQADGNVQVPDAGALQRARQIRDELRKRSGDQGRDKRELDYIDRLLDQFN